MLESRDELAVAVGLNNKIYAIGGFQGSVLNSVEEYDPVLNKWKHVSSLL